MRDPNEITGARHLWAAVLLKAIDDAINGADLAGSRENKLLETKRARDYLSSPSEGLATVCSLAGVDMHALIERMRIQIANAPTPEELASQRKVSAASVFKKSKASAKPKPRTAATYTHEGETLTIAEWSAKTGVPKNVIATRLNSGWDVGEALTMSSDEAIRRGKARLHRRGMIARASNARSAA